MRRAPFLALMIGCVLVFAGCGKTDETGAPTSLGDSNADLRPAIWTLSDDDTTVHLFGTVHVLKPGTGWKTNAFESAFAASDAVFLEADLETPSVLNRIQSQVSQLAVFTDGSVLDDFLDDDEEILFDQAASLVGLEPSELQYLRPWLLSQSLSERYAEQKGYKDEFGVEQVLLKDARLSAKQVRYLEAAENVLQRLGELPEEDTADLLVATAEDIMRRPDSLDALVGFWGTGDVDSLARVFRPDGAFGSKAVYDLLIVDRNEDWARQIDQLMSSEEGTFMIAVGAGHLAGPDRLQVLLEQNGYSVQRN